MDKHIYIKLFGNPTIVMDDQIVTVKRKKARALIYYLAAENRPVSRTELVNILWPDFDRAMALKNVSTYLHNIRLIVPELIVVEKNHISLSKQIVVDTRELERYTLRQNYEIRNHKMVDELYNFSFLEHFLAEDSYEYEQWKTEKSEYYLNQVINYKHYVAEVLMEREEYQEALYVLQHIIKLDPYREDVYKLAMQVNCKLGNRAGAIKLFEQLTHMLRTELGVSPMSDTIELYSSLIMEDIQKRKEDIGNRENELRPKKTEYHTIEDIILNLSSHARMVLQLLAVCKEKVDFRIIRDVLGISEGEIYTILDELRTSRALSIGEDNRIVFLSQDEKQYVHDSISLPQRKYLHYRLAKTLMEYEYQSYEKARNVLYHAQHSGDNRLILESAMRVGRMAEERGDFPTAIQCYKQAINYLVGRDRMELIEYMSQLTHIKGDCDESKRIFEENARIAGDNHQLGIESCFRLQAQLTMPEYTEMIWGGIKPQYPIELTQEIELYLSIGEYYLENDVENLNFYIMFLHCKASCLEMQMNFDEAKKCYEKVLKLVMNHSNIWFENYVSNCYLKLGIYEKDRMKAEEYLSMGIAYTGAKKNWRKLPHLLVASSEYQIISGKFEMAKKNLDWAESLEKKYSNPYVYQAIILRRVQLALAQNDTENASVLLKQLLEQAIQTNSRYMMVAVQKEMLEIDKKKRLQ